MKLFKKRDVYGMGIVLILYITVGLIFGYMPWDMKLMKEFRGMLKEDHLNFVMSSTTTCGPCRLLKKNILENAEFQKRNPKIHSVVFNVMDGKIRMKKNYEIVKLLMKRRLLDSDALMCFPTYSIIIFDGLRLKKVYESGGYGPNTAKTLEEQSLIIMKRKGPCQEFYISLLRRARLERKLAKEKIEIEK
ncbi:hypothetical protein KAU32_12545 [bacterium]|nr:hypothetical protein [bacterium]